MPTTALKELIKDGDLSKAASLVKTVLHSSENVSGTALSLMQALSRRLTGCEEGGVVSADCHQVFELALSCSRASLTANLTPANRTRLLQSIYRVSYHLSKMEGGEDCCRKLLLELVHVKRSGGVSDKRWNSDDKFVFKNAVLVVRDALTRASAAPDDLCSDSLWHSVLRLSQTDNYQNLSDVFHLSEHLLSKVTDLQRSVDLADKMFAAYHSYPDSECALASLKHQNNSVALVSWVNSYVSSKNFNVLKASEHRGLMDLMSAASNNCREFSPVACLIKHLILMLQTVESDDFSSHLARVKSSSDVLQNYPHKILVVTTVKLFYYLFSGVKSNEGLKGRHTEELLETANTVWRASSWALSRMSVADKEAVNLKVMFLSCYSNMVSYPPLLPQPRLKSLFSVVYHLVSTLVPKQTSTVSMREINSGVYFCWKVIEAYRKADCGGEAKKLCLDVVSMLNGCDFPADIPDSLKDFASQIVRLMTEMSVYYCFSYECLFYLIAIHHDAKPIFSSVDAFQLWSYIKLQPGNNVLGVTAVDVIKTSSQAVADSSSTSAMDEILKWPHSSLSSVDSKTLLLPEIQSYVKHQELKEEALVVYKSAVRLAQSSKTTLGRVVCCVADTLTFHPSTTASVLSKITVSIENMIKILSKPREERSPSEDIDRMLVLGDLLYYLARSNIWTLRKEAAKNLEEMANNKSLLPVVKINGDEESDPLNFTQVEVNQFSFLSYGSQERVVALLSRAVEAWSHALPLMRKCGSEDIKRCESVVVISIKCMKAVGYLFRLYRSVEREVPLWQLLFQIASLASVNKHRIIAFCELVNSSKAVDGALVEEMEEWLRSVEPSDLTDCHHYLLVIALANHKLYRRQFEESKKLLDLLNERRALSLPRPVYCRMALLSYHLSCALNGATDTKARKLTVLLQYLRSTYGSFEEETVCQNLEFELSLMVGRMMCQGKDPRYARLYTKQYLTKAQQLHLCLRTCELLTLQGEIDESCCMLEDSETKVKEVASLMELTLESDLSGVSLHSDTCHCPPCQHLEYQLALANLTLLMARCKRRMASRTKSSFDLLKLSQSVVSRAKKRGGGVVSELLDQQIKFSVTAVELLSEQGKVEKAEKYCSHTADLVQRHYQPCHSSLASVHLNTFLTFTCPLYIRPVVPLSLPQPADTLLSSDEEVENGVMEEVDAITPLPSAVEADVPPPIDPKHLTACKVPVGVDKLKKSKLIFATPDSTSSPDKLSNALSTLSVSDKEIPTRESLRPGIKKKPMPKSKNYLKVPTVKWGGIKKSVEENDVVSCDSDNDVTSPLARPLSPRFAISNYLQKHKVRPPADDDPQENFKVGRFLHESPSEGKVEATSSLEGSPRMDCENGRPPLECPRLKRKGRLPLQDSPRENRNGRPLLQDDPQKNHKVRLPLQDSPRENCNALPLERDSPQKSDKGRLLSGDDPRSPEDGCSQETDKANPSPHDCPQVKRKGRRPKDTSQPLASDRPRRKPKNPFIWN